MFLDCLMCAESVDRVTLPELLEANAVKRIDYFQARLRARRGQLKQFSTQPRPKSGLGCLMCGLDCLMSGLGCLMCGLDCLMCGIDCLMRDATRASRGARRQAALA